MNNKKKPIKDGLLGMLSTQIDIEHAEKEGKLKKAKKLKPHEQFLIDNP
jgi:hypothetical protein